MFISTVFYYNFPYKNMQDFEVIIAQVMDSPQRIEKVRERYKCKGLEIPSYIATIRVYRHKTVKLPENCKPVEEIQISREKEQQLLTKILQLHLTQIEERNNR